LRAASDAAAKASSDSPGVTSPTGPGEEPNFTLRARLSRLAQLFKNAGFFHCVIAFGMSEAAINSFSSFMNDMLDPEGFGLSFISAMGIVFIVACMIGSSIAAKIVDLHHNYRTMMILCFVGSVGALVIFSCLADDRIIGTSEPAAFWVVLTIILAGGTIGPIQPVAIETGAECTYPSEEADLTAVMQLTGNLFSTVLVPILSLLKSGDNPMEIPNWVLAALLGLVGLTFLTFNGEYRRLVVDNPDEEVMVSPNQPDREPLVPVRHKSSEEEPPKPPPPPPPADLLGPPPGVLSPGGSLEQQLLVQ